jgi:hypothetical protein
MSYLLDSDIGLLTHFKDLKVYYIKKLKKTKDTVGIGSDMLSAFDKGEPIFCRNQNGESSGSFYLLNGSSRAFALVDLEESKDTAEYAISEFRKRDFETC